MELYILVENGKPINHPLLKENVEMVYPDVDFVAPVDYPNDGNFYIWNEEQLKWDPI